MWERVPTATLACLALCALVVAFAGADLAHTESRLPDANSPACKRDDAACLNTRLSEQLARDRAGDPLQNQYDTRAWLYCFAILAIAAVVLLLATDGSSVAPTPTPTLLIPVALVVAAASGTLIVRSESWAQQGQANGVREMVMLAGKLAIHIGTVGQAHRSRMEEVAGWLSLATLGLTALTCLFALVFVLAQPGCDVSASPPGWTNPIDSIAAVTAIGAMAAAVGALVLRRWIVALGGLVICPVALLFVLASTCAFY